EYHHTPVIVGIDIYNLETEAYGAVVAKPTGIGIPAIEYPPFATLNEALEIEPYDPGSAGRIALSIEAARRLADEFPAADVRVPVAGPLSIAFNLRGINNLCEDVACRPGDTARFLMRLADNQQALCHAVHQARLGIAFFESAAAPPILSPTQFHDLELPALQRVLDIARFTVGHPVPCIMGGNTRLVLDDLLATGTDYLICSVETDQRAFVHRVRQTHPAVKIRINMDPVVIVSNNWQRLQREVDRIVAIADGDSHCLMGTGALPYEALPATVHAIEKYAA
ncbi:MAG: uroporphyrinogen decarboxylase family protein, partial [Pirellulaceae bacterium]